MRWVHGYRSFMASGVLGSVVLVSGFLFQPAQAQTIDEIKASFDEAMVHGLVDRVSKLNRLDETLDHQLFVGRLSGQARAEALYYQYHVQMQLAKFPNAYRTYALRLSAWRDAGMSERAHTTFLRDLNQWERQNAYDHMAAICRQVGEDLATDEQMESMALYHLAKSYYRMPGMLKSTPSLCEHLIRAYPKSKWRPEAMRLLANTHFGMGKHNEAIGTLNLLEQQYPNTRLAHYANMRVAAVWEYGRGEPQRALAIYQRALKQYPDHIYAPYIHRQMERLQGVIEQQLILDALEGLAQRAPQNREAEPTIPGEPTFPAPGTDQEPAA